MGSLTRIVALSIFSFASSCSNQPDLKPEQISPKLLKSFQELNRRCDKLYTQERRRAEESPKEFEYGLMVRITGRKIPNFNGK